MPAKERASKKQGPGPLAELTEIEQDLLWHLEHGYQLETDSLGRNLLLRKVGGEEVIRPASANSTTVEALRERGLIAEAKSHDPLKIVWRTTNRSM